MNVSHFLDWQIQFHLSFLHLIVHIENLQVIRKTQFRKVSFTYKVENPSLIYGHRHFEAPANNAETYRAVSFVPLFPEIKSCRALLTNPALLLEIFTCCWNRRARKYY